MLTIDASVWVAAVSPGEPERENALALVDAVSRDLVPVHQPVLSVIEVIGAVARRTRDTSLAQSTGQRMAQVPGLVTHPLDRMTAAAACAYASVGFLRGADAVYVATASRLGSSLVTLDREMIERARPYVNISTPAEWLAHHGARSPTQEAQGEA